MLCLTKIFQDLSSSSNNLFVRFFCGKDKVWIVLLQEASYMLSNLRKTWSFPKSGIVHFHSHTRNRFFVIDFLEWRDLEVFMRERYAALLVVRVKMVPQLVADFGSVGIDSPQLVFVEAPSHPFNAGSSYSVHPAENPHLAFKFRPLNFHSHRMRL